MGVSGAIEVGLDDLNRIEHPVTIYIGTGHAADPFSICPPQ
jgi:hypothetical protein